MKDPHLKLVIPEITVLNSSSLPAEDRYLVVQELIFDLIFLQERFADKNGQQYLIGR